MPADFSNCLLFEHFFSVISSALDCQRLGEAADSFERVHRSDGGGCECCVIYFWFLPAWG